MAMSSSNSRTPSRGVARMPLVASTMYNRPRVDDSGNMTVVTPKTPSGLFNFGNIVAKNVSTPKKKTLLYCPFDVTPEKLSHNLMSPSCFTAPDTLRKEECPAKQNEFSPCIEWQSTLHAVEFDTSNPAAYMPAELTASKERRVQQNIAAFFRSQRIVPSPEVPPAHRCVLQETLAIDPLEMSLNMNDQTKSVSCQTEVTIPPGVDLDQILGQFATYNDGATLGRIRPTESTAADLLQTSLNSSVMSRRKLFQRDGEEESCVEEESRGATFSEGADSKGSTDESSKENGGDENKENEDFDVSVLHARERTHSEIRISQVDSLLDPMENPESTRRCSLGLLQNTSFTEEDHISFNISPIKKFSSQLENGSPYPQRHYLDASMDMYEHSQTCVEMSSHCMEMSCSPAPAD